MIETKTTNYHNITGELLNVLEDVYICAATLKALCVDDEPPITELKNLFQATQKAQEYYKKIGLSIADDIETNNLRLDMSISPSSEKIFTKNDK